jgi:hypothetical protein
MKLRVLTALLGGLVALVAFSGIAAAADPVVIDQRIEGARDLTVGDRFRYVIKIEADRGTTVSLAPGGLPQALALAKSPEVRSRSIAGGRIELTMTLEVAAFVPGELELPPVRLAYRGPGGASGQFETRASSLVVQSVLETAEDLSPRDLKPQAQIGAPAPVALYAAIGVLVLAFIAVLAAIYWRQRVLRRRAMFVPEPEPEALTPEDRARSVLDRAGREFDASREYVAYYSDIAVSLRNYLTERFGFPAFALTTSELQREMERRGVDRWQARLASGLLSQCDAVIYAHYRPAIERADADLTGAFEIVELSRPEPVAEEVALT